MKKKIIVFLQSERIGAIERTLMELHTHNHKVLL